MIVLLLFYYIYVFIVNCMCMMVSGNYNVLIINLCDIFGFVKELKKWCFFVLFGFNILFVVLMEYFGFKDVDFFNLKFINFGGIVLVSVIVECWKGVIGCIVVEGYGFIECLLVVIINFYGEQVCLGMVGILVVGMVFKVIDEQGNELFVGECGEFCVKGL